MKRKPHAGPVANRSGDRRIISASLTEKNCPCPRRFHGVQIPKREPPIHAMPGAPACSRLSANGTLNAGHRPALLGALRVPAKSRNFPPLSRPFPPESQDIPPLSQRVPQLSRPVPPSCRGFRKNPSHFRRRAGFFPEIPRFSDGFLCCSPGIPKAPGDSQGVSLEPFTPFQPFHGRINH